MATYWTTERLREIKANGAEHVIIKVDDPAALVAELRDVVWYSPLAVVDNIIRGELRSWPCATGSLDGMSVTIRGEGIALPLPRVA